MDQVQEDPGCPRTNGDQAPGYEPSRVEELLPRGCQVALDRWFHPVDHGIVNTKI